MANRHNIDQNRWWPYAVSIAENRNKYTHEEILVRIVSLMEMAHSVGAGERRAVGEGRK